MQTVYLNDQPVTIIARENRHEVWVEKTDGTVLRVFKAGLSDKPAADARQVRLTCAPMTNRFHGVAGAVNGVAAR